MRIQGLRVPPVAHARAVFPRGNTAPGGDPSVTGPLRSSPWCGGAAEHTLSATFLHAAHRGAPHSHPRVTG